MTAIHAEFSNITHIHSSPFSSLTSCLSLQASSPKVHQERTDSRIHTLKQLGNVPVVLLTA